MPLRPWHEQPYGSCWQRYIIAQDTSPLVWNRHLASHVWPNQVALHAEKHLNVVRSTTCTLCIILLFFQALCGLLSETRSALFPLPPTVEWAYKFWFQDNLPNSILPNAIIPNAIIPNAILPNLPGPTPNWSVTRTLKILCDPGAQTLSRPLCRLSFVGVEINTLYFSSQPPPPPPPPRIR